MDNTRLKRAAARGAVNNLLFAGAGNGLGYLQVILVMRILGPSEIGLFAVASAVAITMASLSDFGIGDRLIQQDAADLRESYDSAVSLHLLLALVLWGLIVAAAPLMSRFYHQPRLVPLMAVMSYVGFTGFLQLPLSLLFRELRYFEQRLFVFQGKAAAFVITVGLALLGAGVWCLVFGGLAELLVTAIPAWRAAPLRPRWRLSIQHVRQLMSFGLPVWMSKLSYVLVQQGTVLVLSAFLVFRDVGQFRAAEQLAGLVVYLEIVLGQTMFPILCKVKNSEASLESAFTKASRLSMLWIAGASFCLWLFADPIVRYVLTPKWHGAELFLKAQGLGVLFGATIFNWDVLCKAKGATRLLFYVSVFFAMAFVLVFIPMVYVWRREGAAIGVVLLLFLMLVSRKFCLNRLKLKISLISITKRAVISALLAAGAALSVRHFMHFQSPLIAFICELIVFLTAYSGTLGWLEWKLLGEAVELARSRGLGSIPKVNLTSPVG